MWIRSQNKEKLADLRVFDISKTGYTNMPYKICGYSDDWANTNNFHIDLGHYSTKEKALKVLDMIQERICGINGILKLNGLYNDKEREQIKKRVDEKIKDGTFLPDSHFTHIPTPLFFQMPQDDEV